jgi:AraC-like DNA-binding protein
LGTGEPDRRSDAERRSAEIMARFEDALTGEGPARPLPTLSARIGISERTLRSYCTAFLGCSPFAYARLRRLNLVRSALLEADHEMTGVTEVARTHGFSECGRFAVAYRRVFGETPRATLLRNSAESA